MPPTVAATQILSSARSSRWAARIGPSNATSPVTSSRPDGKTSQARRLMSAPYAGCLRRSARRSRLVRTQEAEKLYAFTQPSFHHLPAHQHLAQDFPDLRRAEIETLVEVFEMVIDVFARQMRIANRRKLHTFLANEVDHLVLFEPAVFDGLVIQRRTRIGRCQRHLDRVRIDFLRVLDRLFDGCLRLAGQTEDEGAVNLDAELAAVFAEAPRDVRTQALLDVQQDLVVARFIADQQQAQTV